VDYITIRITFQHIRTVHALARCGEAQVGHAEVNADDRGHMDEIGNQV